MKALSWILSVVSAAILLQTLYFKFTGAPESVALFTPLKMEPQGRYMVGIAELIASILLLIPKTRLWGALMGIGLMLGALFFHLTLIGIVDANGSPLLFIYALVVFISCSILVGLQREKIKSLISRK